MMRGNTESLTVNNPQEVDIGRRNLLVRSARLAGAGAAIYALSKTEPAYAAVKKITGFRERRGRGNSTLSPSLDTQTTVLDISQGQPGNIQDTPTPDATVVALQKDKAIQDDIAAKNQNNWWRTNVIPLFTTLTGVAALGTIAVNVWQYKKSQKAQYEEQKTQEQARQDAKLVEQENQREIDQKEREKRDEARFQTAISELGNFRTRIGAAITLRTFLQEGQGYEKFYQQIFDLSVAYLRMPLIEPEKNPTEIPFKKAMTELFFESYHMARDELKRQKGNYYTDQMLDASGVHLEGAYLAYADLESIWMRDAFLDNANLGHVKLQNAYLKGSKFRSADLGKGDLSGANLKDTDFRKYDDQSEETKLKEATLSEAELNRAYFNEADFTDAKLKGVNLSHTQFEKAKLIRVDLSDAKFRDEEEEQTYKAMLDSSLKGSEEEEQTNLKPLIREAWRKLETIKIEHRVDLFSSFANFQGAILFNAQLTNANLEGADFSHAELSYSNIEMAYSLDRTNMLDVKGLTREQDKECERKKADFNPPLQEFPETKNEMK